MSECFFTYGNRHFLAKNLTSYTDIYLKKVQYTPWIGVDCVFGKEFSFGGDLLKIEERFFIPKYQDGKFLKINPIFKKIINGFDFFEYKQKHGKDKKWLDYMKWIAEELEEQEALEYVICQSKEIIDLFNKWSNEGKL